MGAILRSVLLVVSAVSWMTVTGYKNGKVTQACKSMMPEHGTHPSPNTSAYNIIVDTTTFSPGDQIKVTLASSMPGAKYFEGFLIEARDAGNLNSNAVGSFTLIDSVVSQLLNCDHTQGSAVSHTSDKRLQEIHVLWNAPKDAPPSVQFLATVVQHYSIFWVKIPGPVVSQRGVSPIPPHPTTRTTTAKTTTPSILPEPFSSDGCGNWKSCLQDPVRCDPKIDPKCFFLSFTTEGQSVIFELSGPAEGYVSFALSLDKWMGNDDVYLCVKDSDRVAVQEAYVAGRTHPEVDSGSVLTDVAWRLAGGVIQCRFRRNVRTPQEPRRFNLDRSYYLFMAHGRAEHGSIHRHDRQPLISTNQKAITGPAENLSGSRSPLIMKFHGAFMLIAWVTAASTGVLIARYFKPDWQDQTIFGQKVWFQVHRGVMTLAVLLTCAGFVLPFIYRGGWSRRAGAHPYLGCTVMVLAVLQPLMAFFRPLPDSPWRFIFNWMHMGAGTTAKIIAVAAMFLGICQQALVLPTPWSTGILAGVIVWDAAAFLLLELHKRGLLRTGKTPCEDQDIILSESSEGDSQVARFKQVVLVLFIAGNMGFLIALLYSINSV
ncbi:putative ferric-chelate reductase 1 [Megalops cyprinoides]|uniref:putative ferric-chelate reductase 1 n=1 Tax=Megalops cyprinoides TaxID=118141 RepID=UPI001863B130|nr:putative ferric-chelate reductase 1 [Megalops cyprinoides]